MLENTESFSPVTGTVHNPVPAQSTQQIQVLLHGGK